MDAYHPRQGNVVRLTSGTRQLGPFCCTEIQRHNEDETVVTFTAQDEESAAGDYRFQKWVDQAIGMIESPADCKVVVRHADNPCMLSEGFT